MPTGTVRTLSQPQIAALRCFSVSGKLSPDAIASGNKTKFVRTWVSLQKKGLISFDASEDVWVAHWGRLSERLSEQIFPGSFRQTYQRELQRLNEMALDFSEGSNANFMRQITVVKNLREMLIKAEK